jgi:4'-phosphopantetheinyl transferase
MDLLPLLDSGEQARAFRFVFPRDRLTFALGRVLVRRLLSQYREPPHRGWRFVLNPYGRPELPDPGDPPLRFSLSHCRGYVAAACVPGREIGIDVERSDRDCDFAAIARSFFSPAEVEALEARRTEERRPAFFAYWTLKESYIKARGMGLSIPLAQFSFTLDPVAIRFGPGIADDPERWRFWRANPEPDCQLAAAVSIRPGEEVGFCCRRVSWDALLGDGGLE